MDSLQWIQSTGGPLILISEKGYKSWSGILSRTAYLNGRMEEAGDFLNPEETDYGKACLVDDYTGLVDIGAEKALIFGDEPLLTTAFFSLDHSLIVARCYYGASEATVDKFLHAFVPNSIDSWELATTFDAYSSQHYLFDAANCADNMDENSKNYLSLNIKQGKYQVWTSVYAPDEQTKLLLHKFV
jgi:hypothetical protein